MNLFITQPTYLPWVGIFKAIDFADTFVFYDDVQFEKQSWQNRNRLLDPLRPEPVFLTIPVAKHSTDTAIQDVRLAEPGACKKHLRKIAAWYARAPFLEPTLAVLQAVYAKSHTHLADLTSELTMALARYIGVTAEFKFAHDFGIHGDKYTRTLAFARSLGSTVYLTQAGTRGYTNVAAFREHGIEVVFLEFAHPVYRQLREPFTSHLSIVDMLMNIGPQETLAVIQGIRLEEASGGETRCSPAS